LPDLRVAAPRPGHGHSDSCSLEPTRVLESHAATNGRRAQFWLVAAIESREHATTTERDRGSFGTQHFDQASYGLASRDDRSTALGSGRTESVAEVTLVRVVAPLVAVGIGIGVGVGGVGFAFTLTRWQTLTFRRLP
jgi:hypothetical protein